MILADTLSKQLLRELSENSRVSSSELARKLKVSPPTIKRRIEKLEKSLGIKYVLELDEDKCGLAEVRDPDQTQEKTGKKS